MTEEFQIHPASQFRLDYYGLCERSESFVWRHEQLDLTIECPLPDDIDNPNCYAVPDNENSYCYIKTDFLPEYNEFNWGTLHAYIENLYLQGWTIQQF